MDIDLEKRQIIEEINNIQDEWLVKALKRLLRLDQKNDISSEPKNTVDSRTNPYESGDAITLEWEEAKKRWMGKKIDGELL